MLFDDIFGCRNILASETYPPTKSASGYLISSFSKSSSYSAKNNSQIINMCFMPLANENNTTQFKISDLITD